MPKQPGGLLQGESRAFAVASSGTLLWCRALACNSHHINCCSCWVMVLRLACLPLVVRSSPRLPKNRAPTWAPSPSRRLMGRRCGMCWRCGRASRRRWRRSRSTRRCVPRGRQGFWHCAVNTCSSNLQTRPKIWVGSVSPSHQGQTELAERGNKRRNGTDGNHRKTGREAERPPRSSSGGQPGPKASNQQPNHCSKA